MRKTMKLFFATHVEQYRADSETEFPTRCYLRASEDPTNEYVSSGTCAVQAWNAPKSIFPPLFTTPINRATGYKVKKWPARIENHPYIYYSNHHGQSKHCQAVLSDNQCVSHAGP